MRQNFDKLQLDIIKGASPDGEIVVPEDHDSPEFKAFEAMQRAGQLRLRNGKYTLWDEAWDLHFAIDITEHCPGLVVIFPQ